MPLPDRALLIRALGRNLTAGDEIPRERLVIAEKRLGFALPDTMVDFYLCAGAAPEFQAHDALRSPEALEVEGGLLIFMEENQNVVDWGIRLPVGADPDPVVWQQVNGDQPTFYSEEMPFSVFVISRLAVTRGVELSEDAV